MSSLPQKLPLEWERDMKPVSNRKSISGTTDRVSQQQEIRAGGGHSEQVRSNESGRQAKYNLDAPPREKKGTLVGVSKHGT